MSRDTSPIFALSLMVVGFLAAGCSRNPALPTDDATEVAGAPERRILSCDGWTFAVRRVTANQVLSINSSFSGDFYVIAQAGDTTSCYNEFSSSGTGVVSPNDNPSPASHTFVPEEIGDSILVTAGYVTGSTTGVGKAFLTSAVGGSQSKIVVTAE